MSTVPFLDLSVIHGALRDELNAAFDRVITSGIYIMGPELEAFEREFADYCEADHAIGLGNGLDALRLALLALGVEPGDEVIVPSHTFIATWLAVTECKAIPVPVEPEDGYFTISADAIEKAITSRTRVIIPVHLYGQPVDLDPVLALAARHGIRVLEDAAQAHGARYKGRRIGSHGDAVAWSFYPGKNLGAFGDGGAVTTNDPGIAESIRMLRNYGSRRKYEHEIEGCNSRLDPLQAAMLRVKLRHLDQWNAQRRDIAFRYRENLSHFGDGRVTLPCVPDWSEPVWHLYVIRCAERDLLQTRLTEFGISTLIHYPRPPHRQAAYSQLGFAHGDFPVAEKLSEEILSLPIYPGLDGKALITITQVFRKIFN